MTRPSAPTSELRPPTEVDRLAESYLDDLIELEPDQATYLGVPGHHDRLPDLSPDGRAEVSALRRRTLAALDGVTPADEVDTVTVAALRESLTVAEDIHATGDPQWRFSVIESPVQNLAEVFDLMPRDTEEDRSTLAARLAAVPGALDGYLEGLRQSAARGEVAPRRQLLGGITHALDTAGPGGAFAQLAAEHPELDGPARAAADAYAELARVAREELLPLAADHDPVGAERYALYSRSFLGAEVDLAESYHWGMEELARIRAEMDATAQRIRPGATVEEARALLDADPARQLSGTEALQRWMQRTSDEVVAELAGTHFDIPEPVRTLRCRIAPSHSGVIYYTGPSEDFSRPGQMWWAVPEGDTEFTTWRQKTTVFHEGVPGHHLQIGQTVFRSALLNRWRRIGSWVSGHGEGWALYAERLMSELGYLDDPGDYLGMLEGQSLRAARVIVDIGVHCGFPDPDGNPWTYDSAWALLRANSSDSDAVLRFELDRYLGWPGQAPSYKLGERFWLQLRADAARSADFDLRAFHRRALDVGSVGLDVLRTAVLG